MIRSAGADGTLLDAWEFMGAFSSQALAEAACTRRGDCVYGPLDLDVKLPDEIVQPDDCYYPLAMEDSRGLPGYRKNGEQL